MASPKSKRPRIMGIINVTPDSFSGDGAMGAGDILKQAESFLQAGADILDVGGESTRPQSEPVSETEELRRVIPVIEALHQNFPEATLSVDSYKVRVVAEALQAGASMANDVTALQGDEKMAETVAKADVPIVLMHNRARNAHVIRDGKGNVIHGGRAAGASYEKADYKDVVQEVVAELKRLAETAEAQGIRRENIILDAGIGFGKSVEQNMRLIAASDKIKALGYEVLLGASRKSFIGKFLDKEVSDRMAGSVAAAAFGAMKGVDIVRVHDVGFTADFLRMWAGFEELNDG